VPDKIPNRRIKVMSHLADTAQGEGANPSTLSTLVEEASEVGAARALYRCGLHDESAGEDIRELRQLLSAWRDARRVAWRSFVRWSITIIFAVVLAGLAAKMNLNFPTSK